MKRFLAWIMILVLLIGAFGCTQEQKAKQQEFEEAEALTKEELDSIFSTEYQAPKNVIVMIADGMGPNDLILCESFKKKECFDFGLALNQIPCHGTLTTHSANQPITDSAAAATALATGVKTNNGMVGCTPKGEALKNISEIARGEGKKVGIVTTDLATGATPSGFAVHHTSRKDTEKLAASMVEFAPDLLIAKSYSSFEKALDKKSKAKLEGYHLSKSDETLEETLRQPDDRPYFCFSDSIDWEQVDHSLATFTKAALEKLENEKGFFLMVESSGTDKCGHTNSIEGKINSVVTFDRAVAVVLRYMRSHPDTLLLITSDHETGGVQLPKEGQGLSKNLFTTTKHTAQPVRVFALGQGAEFFHGQQRDHTDLAKFAISAVQGGEKK